MSVPIEERVYGKFGSDVGVGWVDFRRLWVPEGDSYIDLVYILFFIFMLEYVFNNIFIIIPHKYEYKNKQKTAHLTNTPTI